MATKMIKKAGTYDYVISQKSKNDVYVFANAEVASGSQLKFSCSDAMEEMWARSGDDLVLVLEYGDPSDITTLSINYAIIKDYYKYSSPYKQDLVSLNDSSAYGADPEIFADVSNISITTNGFVFGSTNSTSYNITGAEGMLIDAGGEDTYKLNGVEYNVSELSGNDKYSVKNSVVSISDIKGNDNYSAKNCEISVVDYAGKDSYDIYDADFSVSELNGNDNYTIKNSSLYVTDSVGNDTYYLNNAGGTITEVKGNDNYTIKNFGGQIEDYSGKDVYDVSNLSSCRIADGVFGEKDGGNDKYTVSNITGSIRLEDFYGNENYAVSNAISLSLLDITGNDTYKLANIGRDSGASNIQENGGNDNYSMEYVSNLQISDIVGSDKYGIKGSNDITINDSANGNDVYTVSDSKSINIQEIPNGDIKSGNDTYNYNNVDNFSLPSTYNNILDVSGNEKYNINESKNIRIQDIAGNDKYNISNTLLLNISDLDYSNDVYNLDNVDNYSNSSYRVSDTGGDDKFNIKNSESLTVYIADGGKDSFKVSDSNKILLEAHGSDKKANAFDVSNSTSVRISYTDSSNDVYNLNNVDNSESFNYDTENLSSSGYWIFDQGGNDKFNIKNCESMYVETVTNGQKTYNVSKSNHVYLESHEYDNKGDTYNISEVNSIYIWNTDNSNEVYKLDKVNNTEDSSQYNITDNYGDDKYTIKNSSGIRLYDYYGKDTYDISNANDFWLYDGNKSDNTSDDYTDTYLVKNSSNICIIDYSETSDDIYKFTNVINDEMMDSVDDNGGDDTYTLKKSSNVEIFDRGDGNDTYNIDSLKNPLSIFDCGGDNDTVKISGLKANNVICMANFIREGASLHTDVGAVDDNKLFIFDKNQKTGGLIVSDYFGLDESENFIDSSYYSDGYIENIYAGKKEISGMVQNYITDTDYNEIAESIASWLQTNNMYCVSELFESGNEAKLSEFITYVADNNLY